jgi:hypothetical protein
VNLPIRFSRILAILAAVAGFAPAAFAGPPLICHPFIVDDGAPLLPWAAGGEWRLPQPGYDVAGLVADTLELLSADATILARMENLRRATIYADQDAVVAEGLLAAVLARTDTPPVQPHAAALVWFDAGYLVETYRQLGLVYGHGMVRAKAHRSPLLSARVATVDGYVLVRKALVLAPERRAEIEFAASLMAPAALAATHRRHAAAAAQPGSLLARNLAPYAAE